MASVSSVPVAPERARSDAVAAISAGVSPAQRSFRRSLTSMGTIAVRAASPELLFCAEGFPAAADAGGGDAADCGGPAGKNHPAAAAVRLSPRQRKIVRIMQRWADQGSTGRMARRMARSASEMEF